MERKNKMKTKKFLGHCEKCKKSICEEHAYFFVDGNNESITNNSPYLCKKCYEKTYNTKIKDSVQRYKENLISNLYDIKNYCNVKSIDIDKMIKYIEEE